MNKMILTQIPAKSTSEFYIIIIIQGPDKGGGGGAMPRNFSIANGLSRMNLKLDLSLGFSFWLRLDLPYVPVWPGLSRFKRLSRLAKCP